jgi:hypothetical protein
MTDIAARPGVPKVVKLDLRNIYYPNMMGAHMLSISTIEAVRRQGDASAAGGGAVQDVAAARGVAPQPLQCAHRTSSAPLGGDPYSHHSQRAADQVGGTCQRRLLLPARPGPACAACSRSYPSRC